MYYFEDTDVRYSRLHKKKIKAMVRLAAVIYLKRMNLGLGVDWSFLIEYLKFFIEDLEPLFKGIDITITCKEMRDSVYCILTSELKKILTEELEIDDSMFDEFENSLDEEVQLREEVFDNDSLEEEEEEEEKEENLMLAYT